MILDILIYRLRSRGSMDRASDFGSEGWGFESSRLRQKYLLLFAEAPCNLNRLHFTLFLNSGI